MLIGISGKIGSGKDTVANIIRYLFAKQYALNQGIDESKIYPYETYDPKAIDKYSGWEIKKFAGKLKQIISILTGISVLDLEKQEVKDRLLGKEWETERGMDGMFPQPYIKKYTVRMLLQEVGTDAMRDVIHPNIWVNALFADYKPIGDNLLEGEIRKLREEDLIYPNWIITDVRFPNELDAIRDREGIVIRVNRTYPDDICIHCNSRRDSHNYRHTFVKGSGKVEHPSETALDDAKFDYYIENNSDIQNLIEKVKNILKVV